mgnify:CR=1 FL=1
MKNPRSRKVKRIQTMAILPPTTIITIPTITTIITTITDTTSRINPNQDHQLKIETKVFL